MLIFMSHGTKVERRYNANTLREGIQIQNTYYYSTGAVEISKHPRLHYFSLEFSNVS